LEKAKRKVKNYKLKHSRLLTCYSALLYLLAVFVQKRTVSPTDAAAMIVLTPTERLEWLLQQRCLERAHKSISELLTKYENFLKATNATEKELIERFLDKQTSRKYMGEAHTFGELVFEALTSIGTGNSFHRLLVV